MTGYPGGLEDHRFMSLFLDLKAAANDETDTCADGLIKPSPVSRTLTDLDFR